LAFAPKTSTVDAALAAKYFAIYHFKQRNYVVMISLDVLGAFDAASTSRAGRFTPGKDPVPIV
jgi:hypothetical protein